MGLQVSYVPGHYGIGTLHRGTVSITSGDQIKLKTDGPENKPLPSFEILELQWFPTRVAWMTGAVDVNVLDIDKDSDDDSVQTLN